MKTFTILAISAMVFFSIAAVPAPEKITTENKGSKLVDGFTSVRSHRQGRGAEISWEFSSSSFSSSSVSGATVSSVSGFTVQRTNEDPNDPYSVWIDVGVVGGNPARSYKVHDDNPFPGLINYRIIATMSDGSTVTSQVSTVRIMSH